MAKLWLYYYDYLIIGYGGLDIFCMNMEGCIRSLSVDVLLSAILLILPLNILLESQNSLVYTVCVSWCVSL